MNMFKKLCLLCLCVHSLVLAETEFATPKPAIDNPRKIVFSIDTIDDKEVNHVISTVNNVIKFYRPENTEVVVVVYSQGVKILRKDSDIHTKKTHRSFNDLRYRICCLRK